MSTELSLDSPGVLESDLRLLQAGNFVGELLQLVVPGFEYEGFRPYEEGEAGEFIEQLKGDGVISDNERDLASRLASAMNDLLGEQGLGDVGICERYTGDLLKIRAKLVCLEPMLSSIPDNENLELRMALFSSANEYLDWALQDSRLSPPKISFQPGESEENNLLHESLLRLENDDAA